MSVTPIEIFEEARAAFQAKNYTLALEKYAWFYHNALKIDKPCRGVRLSYCLSEWAALGKQYPLAHKALENLKLETLAFFNKEPSYQYFNEYSSICSAMDSFNEVISLFKKIEKNNPKLAEKVFSCIYMDMLRSEEWKTCRRYLGNGEKAYDNAMYIFDISMERNEKDKNKDDLKNAFYDMFKQEMLYILNMLDYVNADNDYLATIKKLKKDMEHRKFEDLFVMILDSAPNQKLLKQAFN